ncbi:hypothetical protein EYF80_001183 [Liparis tanakae]|uniref:Uncharacterized protein n=1 Tax=Liparis tanakae TaxID=230148 RepID=A0A4Z2JEH2_9TELE|nr:hypothetical protein EYF80_001183 [Liparis tanakae]
MRAASAPSARLAKLQHRVWRTRRAAEVYERGVAQAARSPLRTSELPPSFFWEISSEVVANKTLCFPFRNESSLKPALYNPVFVELLMFWFLLVLLLLFNVWRLWVLLVQTGAPVLLFRGNLLFHHQQPLDVCGE